MGIGDDVIATGLARGAKDRGKRIAFGDGKRIIWGPHSSTIFRGNPNIALIGTERASDIEWIQYYKGHRIYNRQSGDRWTWNYEFRVSQGEIFFGDDEMKYEDDDNLILMEPNVPNKPCGLNKQWPIDRFQQVADELTSAGFTVRQFDYGRPNRVAAGVHTPTFRDAVARLKSARLAILAEGGLHHAAAAVGTPAVVLFGGFVPPEVLGYDTHVNLTGGATACGSHRTCQHCIDAMRSITVDEVLDAVSMSMGMKVR
jgi:hypothetical protein